MINELQHVIAGRSIYTISPKKSKGEEYLVSRCFRHLCCCDSYRSIDSPEFLRCPDKKTAAWLSFCKNNLLRSEENRILLTGKTVAQSGLHF